MLTCSQCNHEQEVGKFCGKCGSPFQTKENTIVNENREEIDNPYTEEKAIQKRATDEPASTVEYTRAESPADNYTEIKENLANFGSFFYSILKNPTQALRFDEKYFLYGMINVVLYALTFAFGIYVTLNTFYKSTLGLIGFAESIPVFPVVSRLSISLLLIAAGVLGVTLLLLRLTPKPINFKSLVSQYGGIITPFILLNVMTIFTGLAGSPVMTVVFLSISFMFALYIIPGLITFELNSQGKQPTQKVYLSLGTIALAIFITYIIARIIVLNYLETVYEMLYYL